MRKSDSSEPKRSHRSRYSLNTQYTFGVDESRTTKANSEYRSLLENWDAVSASKKAKMLRGDVPREVIGELWLMLSGGGDLLKKNVGVFEMLLSRGRLAQGEEDKIIKDIARTFPDVLSRPELQTTLFNVLKAYSVFDSELGYCLADDHEILTSSGFLGIDELRLLWDRVNGSFRDGLQIATLNDKTKQLEFQAATRFVLNPEGSDVFVYEFFACEEDSGFGKDCREDNGLFLRVTAEHDMYVQLMTAAHGSCDEEASFQKVSAARLFAMGQENPTAKCRILLHAPLGAVGSGDKWDLLECVKCLKVATRDQFAAFLQVFGFLLSRGTRIDSGAIRFMAGKSCDADFLVEKLEIAGLVKITDFFVAPTGEVTIFQQSWIELFAEIGRLGENGRITDSETSADDDDDAGFVASSDVTVPQWLWQLEKEFMREVLRGIFVSDQSEKGCSKRAHVVLLEKKARVEDVSVLTSCERFRDLVVRIAIHAGFGARFVLEKDEVSDAVWRVIVSDENTTAVVPLSSIRKVPYQGRTFCVTVPNGLIMARRAQCYLIAGRGVVTKASAVAVVSNCQGLNFIVATLLTHLSAEESFWTFVCLIKGRFELRTYYATGVPELVTNLYCLDRCIELYLPPLFSHFKEQRVSPILFASEWFTTLFGYNFDLNFTTAIWTVFLSIGKLYLFRVAMGILRLQEKDLLTMEFEAIILRLKNPQVSVKEVMEEADRFATIDDRLIQRLKREAAQHTTAENLI